MQTIHDVLRRLAQLLGSEGHAEAVKIIDAHEAAHSEQGGQDYDPARAGTETDHR